VFEGGGGHCFSGGEVVVARFSVDVAGEGVVDAAGQKITKLIDGQTNSEPLQLGNVRSGCAGATTHRSST
jgi:hypothetical protein